MLLTSLSIWAETTSLTLTHPTASISHTLQAEVVATEATRAKGLMHRPTLCNTCAMWFRYPEAGPEGLTIRMWMRNTLIPLDMLFLKDGKVMAVHANAQPQDDTIITSPSGVDDVLEVNGGWAAAHKVTAGWSLAPAPLPASRK